VGMLGMVGIGRDVKKCDLSSKIIYYSRTRLSNKVAGGAEFVSFEELLARSGVPSLNLPLNVMFSIVHDWQAEVSCDGGS